MRAIISALIFCAVPGAAFAAPSCPASGFATAPVVARLPDATGLLPPISSAEIEASPALTRLASRGAQLFRLPERHGMAAVFARKGGQFRVFYLTPDDQAEIGGVMWDSSGRDVTRQQVAGIPGVLPTIRVTAGHAEAEAGAPEPGATSATTQQQQPSIDPFARLAAAHYGLVGKSGAPRVYMVIDPLCPYSIRAFQGFAPYIAAGRMQLAIVPVSINDHENGGASTPAALELLSAAPGSMGAVWKKIISAGHADAGEVPADDAQAALALNMAAAHAIEMQGTPTLVWKDRGGEVREGAGAPGDLDQFVESLAP